VRDCGKPWGDFVAAATAAAAAATPALLIAV
jgi:hypothetical protein